MTIGDTRQALGYRVTDSIDSTRSEAVTRNLGYAFHVGRSRHLAVGEHRDLKSWSIRTESCHLVFRDGLDHVVDMDGNSAGMGPETVVDLVSVDEIADDS